MSKPQFDVVFYGILQPGKDKETAMQNMAALFKTEPAKLAPYFAGGRKVIKGNVSETVGKKYLAALENVGLVIKLEEVDDTGSLAEPDRTADGNSTDNTNKAMPSHPDIGNLSLAPVGADVVENPPEVKPQPIADTSAITMAETGADVLENPPQVKPQPIADTSAITMAETGADVQENPPQVKPQPIADISGLSLVDADDDPPQTNKKD